MQTDLFLPAQEARLRELRAEKRDHELRARAAGEEIYSLIKTATSLEVGARARLCLLPTGGTYLYTVDDIYVTHSRVQEFHAVDLDQLERAVKMLQSEKAQKEAHLD